MEDTKIPDNTVLNIDDALRILDEASEAFKVQAWIPSKKEYYSFKEIDAKQQKNLLGAAIDDNVYNIGFIKSFYNILKENVLEKEKTDIDKLSVVDKISIALHLRKQISSDVLVIFDDKNKISEKIDINPIIEKLKNTSFKLNEVVNVSNGGVNIKANLSYPTVKKELDYDLFFGKSTKKASDVKTNEDIQKIISEAFLTEITKYIDIIYINENEININTLNFDEKIKVIEKLPSVLIQKILEKVSSWKTAIDEALTVSFKDYKKVLSIDSLLFLS